MEKNFRDGLIISLVVAITIVSATSYSNSSIGESQLSGADATVYTGEENFSIDLEIADTPEERLRGLMYRRSLEENHGMLFIFPEEKKRSFWMKNTYIPLDIIYLNENKTIVDIDLADPQPNTSEENLKLYPSEKPAKYVIEMNQGFSENNSVDVGDRVEWNIWEK